MKLWQIIVFADSLLSVMQYKNAQVPDTLDTSVPNLTLRK
jgi:hypothetical protein